MPISFTLLSSTEPVLTPASASLCKLLSDADAGVVTLSVSRGLVVFDKEDADKDILARRRPKLNNPAEALAIRLSLILAWRLEVAGAVLVAVVPVVVLNGIAELVL